MPFQCSICEEPSTRICVRCTKDACENHLCEKCLKCSDCCECEVSLNSTPRVAHTVHTSPAPETQVDFDDEPEADPGAPSEEPAPEAESEPEPTAPAEPHAPEPPTDTNFAPPLAESE
jgi:hypothetical protein